MKNYTLKEMRIRSKKTQKEVADKIGITITYLSLMECGKKHPSDRVKRKLANEYRVNTIDIYKSVEKQEKILMKEG